MAWWKPEATPEEIALTQAAMRVRMQLQNLNQAGPNEIDRAWARIMADSLATTGWKLVKEERGAFGENDPRAPSNNANNPFAKWSP